MDEHEDQVAGALRLMREALALLDRAGERRTAARLQHAIDEAESVGPGPPDEELVRRMLGE